MNEQARVAQTDPEALKKWLVASGRKYLVFNGLDLVDALKWPEGHQVLQQIIDAYRNHRQTKEIGDPEQQTLKGIGAVRVVKVKGERLEPEEQRELWEELGKDLGLAT